jgi:pimeloyl-ACP methyl ester carboxylesterase
MSILSILIAALIAGCTASHVGTDPAESRQPVDVMETVKLGGVDQRIQIRGDSASLPLVLFLHGGPGNSAMRFGHRYGEALEKHFLVAHWDQRGAGRSYHAKLDPAGMTVDRLSADAVELAEHLTKKFGKDKILLVGHSWGSILGITVAAKRPDLFCAYVGVGQVVGSDSAISVSVDYVRKHMRAIDDKKALEQLEALGDPPFEPAEFFQFVGLVTRAGGTWRGHEDLNVLNEILKGSRVEALLHEAKAEDQMFSVNALWKEIRKVDFLATHLKFDIPVYFFLGVHDWSTPSTIASKYLHTLAAPAKKIVWFDHSAHFPHLEEPEAFVEALAGLHLPDPC